MTGAGVVLTSRDAAEVADLSVELETGLQPSNAASRVLLKRFAVLAVRLDRCVEHGDAMTCQRVRDAGKAFNAARLAEVKAIALRLEFEPTDTVRALKETAEGIEWLIREWLSVKGDLERTAKLEWQRWHLNRIDNLLGRNRRESPPSRFDAMARAGWGDFSRLPAEQGTFTRRERKATARPAGRLFDRRRGRGAAGFDPDPRPRGRGPRPRRGPRSGPVRPLAGGDPGPEVRGRRRARAVPALRDFQKLEGWAEDRPVAPPFRSPKSLRF